MIQIVTTPNEFNAAIIKGLLETNGIRSSFASNFGGRGQRTTCTVYCEDGKVAEALELLERQGLLGK